MIFLRNERLGPQHNHTWTLDGLDSVHQSFDLVQLKSASGASGSVAPLEQFNGPMLEGIVEM